MSLYLLVLILVISIPFAFSFEKNLRLYKRWKYIFGAIFIAGAFFITWDILFTRAGCWVFNPAHNSGIDILGLPLEEYLFFISIPYACLFTFYAIRFHFPKYKASEKLTLLLTVVIATASTLVAVIFHEHIYTLVNFIVLTIMVVAAYFFARKVLQYFLAIFPVLTVPFLLVNGFLTGTGIEQAVFSYDSNVIMGVYLFSMPVEDLFYAFSLLLMVFATTELLEHRNQKASPK